MSAEIPGGPQTVAAVLDRVVALDPTREALVGRRGRFRYGELSRAADAAAAALADLGLRPGDRLAACLPNDVDIVVAFLGAMRLGAIWVGVNRALAPPEKAYLLRDSGASLLLGEPDLADEIGALREDLPALSAVLAVDAFAARVARADGAPPPATVIDPFAAAAIAYTSGTTGFPKGAVHSQHNLLLPGAVARWENRWPEGLRQGVVLPLTILNLMVLAPLTAFQVGSCCVCMDRVDALGVAAWVRDEKVGTFAGVPTLLHDLLTHSEVDPADLASLVSPGVGGADCPEAFRDLYRDRFGAEVRIGYGMTEAPTAVTWSDGRSASEPGLCGRPLPQVEIEIRDEGGRVLPEGEVGEVCVVPARRGPWAGIYTPMLGYWNQPEASAEALRDGVYHTGDLGLLASDGNLYLRGRRNDLILRGGANVYPAEVERVLLEAPGVAGAAVVGLSDERLGERVVAAVEAEPGETVDPEALRERCRAALARYKVPDRIEVVARLPRNAMSKVIKRELLPLFRS